MRLLRERPWEPDLVALERLDLSQLVEPALTVWWSYYARRTAFCMIEEKLSSLFRCFFLNFQMLSLVNYLFITLLYCSPYALWNLVFVLFFFCLLSFWIFFVLFPYQAFQCNLATALSSDILKVGSTFARSRFPSSRPGGLSVFSKHTKLITFLQLGSLINKHGQRHMLVTFMSYPARSFSYSFIILKLDVNKKAPVSYCKI